MCLLKANSVFSVAASSISQNLMAASTASEKSTCQSTSPAKSKYGMTDSAKFHSAGKNTLKYSKKMILSLSNPLSLLLKSSKGRDKICGVFQSIAEFYAVCIKNSNIQEIRSMFSNNLIISAIVAGKAKSSMSQARKVFRLFRFLDEIKRIIKTIENKKVWYIKLLMVFSHVMSFLYHIHDNFLWGITIGILSDLISEKNQIVWKNRKNSFSLIKVCLTLFKNLLFYVRRKQKENRLEKIIAHCPKRPIAFEGKIYDICQALLRQREKSRGEALELFLSLLRGVSLIKSLKLTSFNLDKVFVALCGLVSSSISLMKIFKKEAEGKLECKVDCGFSPSQTPTINTLDCEGELRKTFKKRRLLSSSSLIHEQN